MRKKVFSPKVFIVLVSLMGIALFIFLFKPQKIQGPENASDIIWSMFSSAKAGDIEGFLKCFTGEPQAILQSTRQEGKGQAFQEYIKEYAQDIKGVSIINGREENEGKRVFEVEVVYPERNELHAVFLQKTNKGWKISRILGRVIIKPAIPYLKQVIGKNT
ncbi:MAG: hypothetical protein ACMUIM_03265 [bacterium]